jgi:signal transduction histidine kinase
MMRISCHRPGWIRFLNLLIAVALLAAGSMPAMASAAAAFSTAGLPPEHALSPYQNPAGSPPFWSTWWFIGLVVWVLSGGVFAIYHLCVRGVVMRNRELERLLAARTAEVERNRRELESLYRADEELSRYLRLDQVLQALVDTAVHLLRADKGALMMWDDRREKLTLRYHRGFHPAMVGLISLDPGEGVAGRVAVTGEPAIVRNTATDPRVTRNIVEPEGIRSFMQVPITAGGEILGVFSADSLHPGTFGEADLNLLITLAQRAARAIENAQRYERAQETVVAEERSRLARELHDAVTQTLFSASLIADVLPRVWAQNPEKGRQQLEEVRLLTRGALAEMRTLLLELRPEALLDAQMEDLLGQLGRALSGRTGVPVDLEVGGQITLPAAVQIALYRIAQESLNNIARHAEAAHVKVQYHSAPGHACLCIRDDGRGFEVEDVDRDHFGLQNMRERAAAIGAWLEIVSQPGAGTQITVEWQEEPQDASRETDSRPDR